MKTTCQSGDPGTDGIPDCGWATRKAFASSRAIVGVADRTDPSTSKSIIPKPGIRPPSPCYGVASDPRLQLLAAAKHDRKAPTRPSLPRSAPPGEERTDHGVQAQRAESAWANWSRTSVRGRS